MLSQSKHFNNHVIHSLRLSNTADAKKVKLLVEMTTEDLELGLLGTQLAIP